MPSDKPPHRSPSNPYGPRMSMSRLSKRGLPCLCLALLLTACAKPAIRTETIEVKTPVYIALPTGLTRPCVVDMPATWTNGSLLDYALQLRACLATSNDKLGRIQGLQPK